MKEHILKNGEPFEEFPNKKLEINAEDNVYLLKYQNSYIVVRYNSQCVTNIEIDGKQVIKEERIYYSVIDNKIIARETLIFYDFDVFSNFTGNIQLLKLSDIFRVPKGSSRYFDLSQIQILNNYNDEDFICENPTSRKYYF